MITTTTPENQPSYILNLPPRPHNDLERIQALLEYAILDTAPEKEYDDLTLLATEICDMPISSIGFIDADRQVLKSNRGLADVSPREMSFCNHTISEADGLLIIPDSRQDKRFVDHPAVVNAPNVIFYAGISLINEKGYALGTLCVVDNKPRELSEKQLNLLKALANQAMKLLDLRKNNMTLSTVGRMLQKRAMELRSANAELESFSYTVSHDLQSPLRSITSFSKLLINRHQQNLDEDGKEMLQFLNESAGRMSELVQDLLRFSKLGNAKLEKVPVDMTGIVRDVLRELQPDIKNPQTEVKVQALQPAECDLGLLKQVWANLIGNAIKYSSKKDKPIVEIGTTQQNNQTVYYVKDNGAGFDMKLSADKLFGVFQRMHHADEFEGTGIGLSSVQKIISRHGGKIWAEAEVDKGATFYFTLSAADE